MVENVPPRYECARSDANDLRAAKLEHYQ